MKHPETVIVFLAGSLGALALLLTGAPFPVVMAHMLLLGAWWGVTGLTERRDQYGGTP